MEKSQTEVSKKISEVEKSKVSNEEAIKTTRERLSNAQSRLTGLNRDIAVTREQRQAALAKGEETIALQLSKKLKDIELETELKTDEITGLETYQTKLNRESVTLTYEVKRLSIRTLQLNTVALAKQYNELASELAKIVRELNETNWEIEREGGGLVQGDPKVVFHLKEGSMECIPRLLFDEDAPYLEEYVARHPGIYPSNLKPVDRCYYDKANHLNEMTQSRTAA